MIACLNPNILVNPAVYEAVAFSHKVVCDDVPRYFNGISKLYRHPLSVYLYSLLPSITQDNIKNYYTFDRHNIKVYLFIAVPCRHCILCLHSDQNLIASRLMLESESHDAEPYFCTLTFGSWSLPKDNIPRIRHLQLFMKRLRFILSVNNLPNVRFYAQGEFGKKHGRCHFHVLLFGLPNMPHSFIFNLVQSAWLTNKIYTHLSHGHVISERLPIGNVYVSQINDPNYRAYYERKNKRPLNPSDGLRYCCKYNTKNSCCRTWSLGLGKHKALTLIQPLRDIATKSMIRPDWNLQYINKYGTRTILPISRWLLHIAFQTFNRKTYYYRSKLYDYVNYLVSSNPTYYDNQNLFSLCSTVGINPYDLHPNYCKKSYSSKRQKLIVDKDKYRKWLSSLKFHSWIDNYLSLPFDFYRNESILYNNFCTIYFSNRKELNSSDIKDLEIKFLKYYKKQQTLITL